MELYTMPTTATTRAVLLTAKALGLKLDIKVTNTRNGDQMKPEFIKMNPQHTIPTLNDHGFCIWETRVIMTYLAEKYGKNTSLYPTDPEKRAIINQRLYFDMGTLNQRFGEFFYPQIIRKEPADPEKLKKVEEALGFLNTFLDGHKYAAGDTLTLADLTLVTTVSTIEAVAKLDLNKYPNVAKWYQLCKKTISGYDEINEKGLVEYVALLKSIS